jgi:4-oxalocrotonate tautomerase
MIASVTGTMVGIGGEALRGVTRVLIDEVKSGDRGIGGTGLTAEDAHALQGGAPVTAG